MRIAQFLTATLITAGAASGALAHPGHLEQVAGHDHWELLGGIVILAAAGAVLFCAWRRS